MCIVDWPREPMNELFVALLNVKRNNRRPLLLLRTIGTVNVWLATPGSNVNVPDVGA